MNRIACTLALGLALILGGCGPLKRLRPHRPVADSTAVTFPLPDTTAAVPVPDTPVLSDDSKMAMAWWQVPLSYTTFSGKARAHYDSPEETRDFTLNVRIESGQRIWMSVVGSALGISMEAFRAVLTPDSMIAIDRINKQIIRAPFSELASLFPVQGDFYSLEAILAGSKIPAVPELRPQPSDTAGSVVISGGTEALEQVVIYRRADSVMIRQSLWQPDSRTELSYDGYQALGERRFARKRGLVIESASGRQRLDLEFTSFSFDEPVDMTLSLPEKYKQR